MISDYFKFSLNAVIHRGIRSWLTMLGIFVGIATIVSLISLGQGLQNAMNSQFEMMGFNIVLIMPGAGIFQGGGASSASILTEEDKKVIEKVRGVDVAGGLMARISGVKYKDETLFTMVSGLPTDNAQKIIEDMQQVRLNAGRKFTPEDKYVVIIGSRVAGGKLFSRNVGVGDKIQINGHDFKVIGTLESMGARHDDESLYIPLKTAQEVFNTNEYAEIMARTKEGYVPGDVANDIKDKLRKFRNEKKGEEDFTVQTSEEILQSVGVILTAVNWFLIGIATISLIVGAIGIMNTMYTSVLERTREIGVMKAIGATNRDVMLLFLIESGVVGMTGGIIGCILGLLMSKTVELISASVLEENSMIRADVSIGLIAAALLISFTVGCISGVLPALQAAKMKPVDALHYE
jgi:putative ABC transport system permease protein